MRRKNKEKPILEKVLITDVATEGKGVGKADDKVVFVKQNVPGDIVDIQVSKKRSNYYEGYPIKFHQYSDIRVEPFCEHFGVCGGCSRQNIIYEKQIQFKENEVYNNLKRIGKIELPDILPILASPLTQFYRNKLEFTFSNRRWLTSAEIDQENIDTNGLGFHIPGMFNKVVDIKKCWLQDEPSNAIRLAIKEFAIQNSLSFFDFRIQKGFLRNLIIRTTSIGEVMVIIVFFHEDEKARIEIFNHLIKLFPQVTSWMYVINSKSNDSLSDQTVKLFHGRDYIVETLENLHFKIGPKSFFQTNSLQTLNLYRIIRDFADLSGIETVYDLYTGTGSIANFVAFKSKKVVGIEYISEAIIDANENSRINNISNTLFLNGDIKNILNNQLFEKEGFPNVLITDPPRAGMHKDVTDTILNSAPEKIVYVSCNSATQARDINLLDSKYKVIKIQPVDMFPHTHHVENVVLLKRK
ncbi:MAG: 23S rRNA (uracil(1939)-C(5))-methyltransferase RlmD [Marinilabiliaceae bacterium]|nr:23S rRNA (uracil(1939)-C(5))-methyltransferase RlmD [Marinilabiliaceae bacterium]